MKVYRVNFDHRRYQMIGTIPGFLEKHPPTHAKAPRLENWECLRAEVDNPTKRRGDFLQCGINYLVCKREITEAFAPIVPDHVQALPIQLDDEPTPYDLWNVTTYVDALDTDKTQYRPPPFTSIPLKWVFRPDQIGRPMLFRIPQLSTAILVSTDCGGDPQNDFYLRYKELKLQGLKFEVIWECD